MNAWHVGWRRALLCSWALMLVACAGVPVGIVGSVVGTGETSLARQLERAGERPSADAPRTVFVGAAMWGSQGVFDRDVTLLDGQFAAAFGAGYRSVRLSNQTVLQEPRAWPLGVPPNLVTVARSLKSQHRAGDRYVLLLTTHGVKDVLAVEQLAVRRDVMAWPAADIGKFLSEWPQDAPLWVIVSACYSGSLLPQMKQAHVLTMTAANATQPSFGCSDDSPNTWFVKELSDALAAHTKLEAAWQATLIQVAAREKASGLKPSMPQWQPGARWQPSLGKAWVAF